MTVVFASVRAPLPETDAIYSWRGGQPLLRRIGTECPKSFPYPWTLTSRALRGTGGSRMSGNGFEFNPETEEGTRPFELLPKGKYAAEVVDAAIVDTKNGRGQMLKLTWVISGGEYDDRRVFQQIIVQHESEDAMNFGRRKIKDLCDACGIRERVSDVEVFLHKPCEITVGIEEDKSGQYDPKNTVRRIAPLITLNAPLPTGEKPEISDKLPF